jgi:hypothetical protein
VQVQTWYIQSRTCVHSQILLCIEIVCFVHEYLATRKCRIRQYAEYWRNVGTQEVHACEKCSSSARPAEITTVLISSSVSCATTGYGCIYSILLFVSAFCACLVVWVHLQIASCDGVRLPSQHCGLGPVVLSPDDSECEPVSRRYRLGITTNLTTRALWPSPESLWSSRRWAKEMRI